MAGAAAETRPVVCIGPMPPPTHGAALMMAAVVSRISTSLRCEVINLSPGTLRRSIAYHVARLVRHLSAARRLMTFRRHEAVVYLSVPGGLGQVYLLLLSPLIRHAASSVFLHHHNYSYVLRPRIMTHLLFRLLDTEATHITLCERMTADLRAAFPRVENVICVSNTWSLEDNVLTSPEPSRDPRLSITHMSNLSIDKGLSRAVNIFRRISEQFDVTLHLAGPFADADAKKVVDAACREFREHVRYWGPVHGAEKTELLQRTDVFLFPSSYVNEAAPLVVDEALGAGALVVCSPVGCLRELRRKGSGVEVTDNGGEDALFRALVAALSACETDRSLVAHEARALFKERRDNAIIGLERLLSTMYSKCAELR